MFHKVLTDQRSYLRKYKNIGSYSKKGIKLGRVSKITENDIVEA